DTSTIDMADTQTAGFNWYRHNKFPAQLCVGSNWNTSLATPASAITVSDSILTLAKDVSLFGLGIASACVNPSNNNAYIGTVYRHPAIFEAKLAWDPTLA